MNITVEKTENVEGKIQPPQSFSTNACGSILEETLLRLFILKRISNGLKMGNEQQFSNTKKKGKDRETDYKTEHNIRTFEKNFNFVEQTLQTVFEEIQINGTYESLLGILKALNETKTEKTNLKEEVLRMQAELEQLECAFFDNQEFYHKKFCEYMANIGKVKDEIEDFLVEAEVKTEYIEKWQTSKWEMNEILLDRKEQDRMNDLRKLDGNLYKETRVHEEILSAFKEMEEDFQIEIDKWKEKYNEDYKDLEMRITELNEKRKKLNEAKTKLKETYLRREKEINDYKLFKVRQEEKQMELRKRNQAATKIQAWWRGTMVRKGFGKFRKKKDKKGKKKGTEKKN